MKPWAAYRLTCPGYFADLEHSDFIEGRDFDHRDVTRGERVPIVNRDHGGTLLARRESDREALKLGPLDNDQSWRTIVGVAEIVRHFGLDSEAQREFSSRTRKRHGR